MPKVPHKNAQTKLLPAVYFEMFAMRVQGYNFKEIAEHTGYRHDWVRTLFSRNGVMHEYWREWVEEHKVNRVEEAIDMAFDHLPDVMKANIKHSLTAYDGAPMARKLIFDLTLGDLIKRAGTKPIGSEHGSIADLIKSSYEEDDETEKPSEDPPGEVAERSGDVHQGQLA